jgi:type II secretion system protein N
VWILGGLGVGIYLLWPTLVRVVAQEALRSAQRNGARISWEGLKVSGFSVSLESFGIWLPGPQIKRGIRPPIKIDLERTQVHVSPWSLLMLNPTVDFSVHAYGGSIEGTASHVRTSPRLSATLRDVDLAKHDQVRPLGIASAVVSGSLSDFQKIGQNGTKGGFDIVVNRIEIPKIPPSLSLVKLSPLSDGEIHLRGTLDSDKVEIERLKITSSYGSADGAGRAMNLSRKGSESADGEFRVSIGDELHGQISPLLPALSNNVLQANTRQFKARMKGFPCSQGPREFVDLELGSLCVRFTPIGVF